MARMRRTLNTEQFINNARQIHGDNYDYSETVYINGDSRVTIICKRCGKHFTQRPRHHLEKHGCPSCSNSRPHYLTEKNLAMLAEARKKVPEARKRARLTTEQFIEKAKQFHGDRYDYSKTKYETCHKKVIIICHEHGEFYQEASSHLFSSGCPICDISKGEKKVAQALDTLGITYEQEKKFPECKDKRPLQFDFYFIYQDVQFLVEFQGAHHYRIVEFFEREGRVKHEWYKRHDEIKRRFAKKYNFVLIAIPYTVKNIQDYLISRIQLHIQDKQSSCAPLCQLSYL